MSTYSDSICQYQKKIKTVEKERRALQQRLIEYSASPLHDTFTYPHIKSQIQKVSKRINKLKLELTLLRSEDLFQ